MIRREKTTLQKSTIWGRKLLHFWTTEGKVGLAFAIPSVLVQNLVVATLPPQSLATRGSLVQLWCAYDFHF